MSKVYRCSVCNRKADGIDGCVWDEMHLPFPTEEVLRERCPSGRVMDWKEECEEA